MRALRQQLFYYLLTFTYAKERENKLRHGEKESGKWAGIARFQ